jgi:hypothetical protein
VDGRVSKEDVKTFSKDLFEFREVRTVCDNKGVTPRWPKGGGGALKDELEKWRYCCRSVSLMLSDVWR